MRVVFFFVHYVFYHSSFLQCNLYVLCEIRTGSNEDCELVLLQTKPKNIQSISPLFHHYLDHLIYLCLYISSTNEYTHTHTRLLSITFVLVSFKHFRLFFFKCCLYRLLLFSLGFFYPQISKQITTREKDFLVV